MDKRAANIMTKKLITIKKSQALKEAYQVMQERKIRHLPVVDDVGVIVGILSDRDIQRAMTPHKENTSFSDLSFEFDAALTVKDFMSWPIKSVRSDVLVVEVAQRMLSEKLSALLVLGEDHVPCGIITTDDMLKLLIKLLEKDPSRLRLGLNAVFDDFSYDGVGSF